VLNPFVVFREPLRKTGGVAITDCENNVPGDESLAAAESETDSVAFDREPNDAVSKMEVFESKAFHYVVAMPIEEPECRPVVWAREESLRPTFAPTCEAPKGRWVQIKVVNGRRTQMSHPGPSGSSSPLGKKLLPRIYEPESVTWHSDFPQEAGGQVNTVNTASDNRPVQVHPQSSQED
jgi:hypothetical protein